MYIDSAIKVFSEKYDRDAIQSIDKISRDYGLVIHEYTIKTFNIKESFDQFAKYLNGYARYLSENKNNENATSREGIRESVKKYIDTQIFEEVNTKYKDLPKFVTEYVNGINIINEAVNNAKRVMVDADVDQESIGDINEYCDMFMTKLHESFDPTMDRILWASGYNTKKKLSGNVKKEAAPVFL